MPWPNDRSRLGAFNSPITLSGQVSSSGFGIAVRSFGSLAPPNWPRQKFVKIQVETERIRFHFFITTKTKRKSAAILAPQTQIPALTPGESVTPAVPLSAAHLLITDC